MTTGRNDDQGRTGRKQGFYLTAVQSASWPPRHQITRAQVVEHPGKFRTVALGADLLRKDPSTAGELQFGSLVGRILVLA